MGNRLVRASGLFAALIASSVCGIAVGTLTPASASAAGIISFPPTPVTFGEYPVGYSIQSVFQLENESSSTITVNLSTGIVISGPGASDYTGIAPNQEDGGYQCPGPISGNILTLTAGEVCELFVLFTPSAVGDRSATATITASDGTQTTVEFSGSGGPTISLIPSSENFGDVALGSTSSGTSGFILENIANVTDTINLSTALSFSGPGADEYTVIPSSGCPGNGSNLVVLSSGQGCTLLVTFAPTALGDQPATLTLQGLNGTSVSVGADGTGTDGTGGTGGGGSTGGTGGGAPAPTPTPHGYWLVGSDGGIFTFGNAQFFGSTGNVKLNRPVVGITVTSNRGGYWLDASDGGVFAFGDASFYGSIPGLGISPAGSGGPRALNAPIVGMVPSYDDGGYFMVASDGGVFTFGDAQFEGSCPSLAGGCSGAAVAVIPDASGRGYWLVTATGNVYTFGDAQYLGAPGGQVSPVTSAVRTPDGDGYWILLANGDVFSYGDAGKFGSASSFGGANPASAIFASSDSSGYWVASANGSVDTFGDAPFDGSLAGTRLNGAIIAATGF
jgi:hypothetical protein